MHYEEFKAKVDRGLFDDLQQGNRIRDLRYRARHIESPILSNETFESFGFVRETFNDYMNMFIQRGLVQDKAVPIDGCYCIEDEFSAVILENYDLRTLSVLSYKNMDGMAGAMMYADMTIVGFYKDHNVFMPPDAFGAWVLEDRIEMAPDAAYDLLVHDLVCATNTAIEQIAYMEKTGKWEEITGEKPDLETVLRPHVPPEGFYN